MAPQKTAKFRTEFLVNFFTSLRKDSVANYALIWTLFSSVVRGFGVLYKRFVVPLVVQQDSQICGGNFPKRKKSAAELCQILRIVAIYIVINSTHHVAYSSICAWQHPAGTALPLRWCFCFYFCFLSRSEAVALFVRGCIVRTRIALPFMGRFRRGFQPFLSMDSPLRCTT